MNPSKVKTRFIILTEESPNIDEIRLMLKLIDCIVNPSYSNKHIIPVIQNNIFSGKFPIN